LANFVNQTLTPCADLPAHTNQSPYSLLSLTLQSSSHLLANTPTKRNIFFIFFMKILIIY
ncbi:MAG: hypothetical protein J0G29_07545, partial [Alphaproteobacteria bacterium]|nr:hypothetical protein [Alphaproteobacteria bacterium]